MQAINNFAISLLAGVDSYWRIVQDKVVHGNGPNAVESKIGYLLLGLLSPHANDETIEVLHVGISPFPTSDNSKQFWNVDLTSKLPSCSSELRIAEYIDYSVRCQPDGSCVVKFPWKPNHPIFLQIVASVKNVPGLLQISFLKHQGN